MTTDHTDPYEYQEPKHPCKRCGIVRSRVGYCTACRSVMTQPPKHQEGFTDTGTMFTICTTENHRGASRKTALDMRAAKMVYIMADLREDPMLMLFTLEHLGHRPLCYITITRRGELLDAWEGYQPKKIAEWITQFTQAAHDLAA